MVEVLVTGIFTVGICLCYRKKNDINWCNHRILVHRFLPHFFFATINEEIGWTCWSFRITPVCWSILIGTTRTTRTKTTTNKSQYPTHVQTKHEQYFFINQALYPPPVKKWSTLTHVFRRWVGNHHCFDATFPLQSRPCFRKVLTPKRPLRFCTLSCVEAPLLRLVVESDGMGGRVGGLTSLELTNRARNTRVGRWFFLLRRPSFRCYGSFGECKQTTEIFFWCAEDVRCFFCWLCADVKDAWDAHRTIGCYFEVYWRYWSLLNICRCFACVPVKNH